MIKEYEIFSTIFLTLLLIPFGIGIYRNAKESLAALQKKEDERAEKVSSALENQQEN